MPAHRLSALLANGTLAPLCDASRRTRELQRIFFDAAPRPLAQATRVKRLKDGTLYLSADNAAVAAKLRQLAPRLLIAIREWVPEVTLIHVDTQVTAGTAEFAKNAKKAALSVETLEKFDKASVAMANSELKTALTALVRHHRR